MIMNTWKSVLSGGLCKEPISFLWGAEGQQENPVQHATCGSNSVNMPHDYSSNYAALNPQL
jgi:hypothetical protein